MLSPRSPLRGGSKPGPIDPDFYKIYALGLRDANCSESWSNPAGIIITRGSFSQRRLLNSGIDGVFATATLLRDLRSAWYPARGRKSRPPRAMSSLIPILKTWSSGPGQRISALPQINPAHGFRCQQASIEGFRD